MTVVRLTGTNKTARIYQDVPLVTENHKRLMLYWWRQGEDTAQIAHRLDLHEWQVANELPRLRGANRATV